MTFALLPLCNHRCSRLHWSGGGLLNFGDRVRAKDKLSPSGSISCSEFGWSFRRTTGSPTRERRTTASGLVLQGHLWRC